MIVTYTPGGKKIKVTQSFRLAPPQMPAPLAALSLLGGIR
jgi:hypothetical protein